jgi:hypothetical protein
MSCRKRGRRRPGAGGGRIATASHRACRLTVSGQTGKLLKFMVLAKQPHGERAPAPDYMTHKHFAHMGAANCIDDGSPGRHLCCSRATKVGRHPAHAHLNLNNPAAADAGTPSIAGEAVDPLAGSAVGRTGFTRAAIRPREDSRTGVRNWLPASRCFRSGCQGCRRMYRPRARTDPCRATV